MWHTPFFRKTHISFYQCLRGHQNLSCGTLIIFCQLFKTCNLAVDLEKALQRSSTNRHMSVKAAYNTCYSSCPTAGLSRSCVTRIRTSPPCNTCYSSCPTAGLSRSCVTHIRMSPPCYTCYSSCPTAGLSQSCVTRIRTCVTAHVLPLVCPKAASRVSERNVSWPPYGDSERRDDQWTESLQLQGLPGCQLWQVGVTENFIL